MVDSMFNYKPLDVESEIINFDNFGENSDEAKLLCLLFGGMTITNNLNEKKIQTKNYFLLDSSEITSSVFDHTRIVQSKLQNLEDEIQNIEMDIVPENLFSKLQAVQESLTILLDEEQYVFDKSLDDFLMEEFSFETTDKDMLVRYFQYMSRHNKEFQSILLFEVTMFFFKCDESPTTAFLHLYRIIELLCFNIPLVYTSKETSYMGAYNKLKNFFLKGGQEFAFFKTFLEQLFRNESEILDQKFIFFINNDNVAHIRNDLDKVYSLDAKEKNTENKNWEYEILEGSKSAKCTVPFKNIIDFVVNIRNRYFHLNDGSGQPNIKNKDYDMDDVFRQLNFSVLNCLSIILLTVSKHSFSSYSIFFETD